MSGYMMLNETVSDLRKCLDQKIVHFLKPVLHNKECRPEDSVADKVNLYGYSKNVNGLKSVAENKKSVVNNNHSFVGETTSTVIYSSRKTKTCVKQSLKAKKNKQSARHKTDSHIPRVKDFNQTLVNCSTKKHTCSILRSVSDPGVGNLPKLDILVFSREKPILCNTESNIRNYLATTRSDNKREKEKISKSIPEVITSNVTGEKSKTTFNEYSKVSDDINRTTFSRHESKEPFDGIETELSVSKEIGNEEEQQPDSDIANLEIGINYTHGDVNFLNSIYDEGLFSDPGEVLYARPIDKNETSNHEGLNQEIESDSSLVNPIQSKDTEPESELYRCLEELERDFLTTIRGSTEDASSSSSYYTRNVVDLNLDHNIEKYSEDYLEPNLETFESDLNDAIEESVNSNTITPIIKKELQYKIQYQRLERGEEELQADFNEPRIYQLTDEEIQKRIARREQNRRSAKKGRVRAKQRERDLAKILNKASASIVELTRQAADLRAEKSRLLRELMGHLGGCLKSTLVEEQKKIVASLAV